MPGSMLEGVVGSDSTERLGTGADGETDHHRCCDEDRHRGDENDNEKEGIVPIHGTLPQGEFIDAPPPSPQSLFYRVS